MSPVTIRFLEQLDQFYNSDNPSELINFLDKTFWESVKSENTELLIASGNEYAGYLRVSGKIKEAHEVYEKIIPLIKSSYGIFSREYTSLLINLGNLYIADCAYIKSLELFSEAEKILSEFPEERNLYAALYNNRSTSFRMLSDTRSAKKDILNALDIVKNDPQKRAVSLINLSEILILSGEFSRADKIITESLEIFERKIFFDPVHYANALSTAGEINYYLGNYLRSQVFYARSLKEFDNHMGNNPMKERILNNYCKVRKILEDYNYEGT